MAGESYVEREAAAIARTGATPVTIATLERDLRALGIQPGSVLIVHASMSAIGWVAGGPVAVVTALTNVLGPDGTLVMPAFSSEWSDPSLWENPPVPKEWWQTIRDEWPAFDPATTPTRQMGAIAESFRTHPGVLRSHHPQESFCARGPEAAAITAGHTLDVGLGEGSPLGRIYERDGSVLLLGVGYGNCSSIHLAEYRCTWPGKKMRQDGAAMLVDGQRRWVSFEDIDGDGDDFDDLGAAFERDSGAVTRGKVGSAVSLVFKQRAIVDYAVEWLPVNRGK